MVQIKTAVVMRREKKTQTVIKFDILFQPMTLHCVPMVSALPLLVAAMLNRVINNQPIWTRPRVR